jgi:hypothetical protein
MHLTCKDKHRLKVKWWKIISQATEAQRHAGVATFISDKADFKQK